MLAGVRIHEVGAVIGLAVADAAMLVDDPSEPIRRSVSHRSESERARLRLDRSRSTNPPEVTCPPLPPRTESRMGVLAILNDPPPVDRLSGVAGSEVCDLVIPPLP